MTSIFFWIACLLVQKSSSLASESNEIASATSQTLEHSSSNYETTDFSPGAHLDEVPSLTTSVNDIECSNTEDCVSPRNLVSTSTTGVPHKVSWRSFTLKRISTEATQTNTNANPGSFSQVNTAATTVQPTNDDAGNELDSEVKVLKEFFTPIASTVTLTDDFMNSTNASVSETNNSDLPTISTMLVSISEASAADLTQEYTTGTVDTMMNNTSTALSETDMTRTGDLTTLHPILKHEAKESTAVPTQDDPFHSVPSDAHSIYNDTTYIPVSFSSSESAMVPTKQMNIINIFHENISTATTKMPDVQTEVTRKLENVTVFSKNEKTFLIVREPESNTSLVSTGLTTEYLEEFTSSNVTLQSESDEVQIQITTMPYTDHRKVEGGTTEALSSNEGYLSMYSVNVSHKEISEGHGLSRNLSYFIPSTQQPVKKTETDRLTELYPTKDISTTTLLQTTSLPHSDEMASSTLVPNNTTLDNLSTEETSHSDSSNESTSNILSFSEQVKTLTKHEPTTHDPNVAIILPEGRMYEEDINVQSTTEAPSTENIVSDSTTLFSVPNNTTLDNLPTEGISHSDSLFESTSNIVSFSEQVKPFSLLTKHEPTTYDPNTSASPTSTQQAVVEIGMDNKDMGTTTVAFLLPVGRMYEEDINVQSTTEAPTTENIVSESTTLFSAVPSTENYSKLPTTILQYQTNVVENTTPLFTEVDETVGYSNPTSLSDLNTEQFATKLVEISSADHSTSSSTPSYMVNRESETTTPITVPATSLSAMEESEKTKSTFSYWSFEPSLTTKLPIAVTIQQYIGKKDTESTTQLSLEQTAKVKPTRLSIMSTVVSSISTQQDNTSTHETYPSTPTTSTLPYSEDFMSSSFPIRISTVTTIKETFQQLSTTSLIASDYSTDSTVPPTIFSNTITEKEESLRTDSVEEVTDSSTAWNILPYSTLSTALPPVNIFTQSETRREGKHIPFSTVATRRETDGLSENGIIRVTSTDPPTENVTKAIYQQMQFNELMPTEKNNIITAAIQFSSEHLDIEEMKVKMVKVHSWLLHVLMKEFQNWTRDPFEETEDESSIVPFGNISIFYIAPTPEINPSGLTLTFIVYNIWKNETLQVDFVLGILNYYSKELKESINASAAYFYHGYEADQHFLMSAILERYGVVIITIGLAVVLILLLVCVVVFYRKKTRRSVHCLSNSKFSQNMHESVGIDLNPAIVILQDEKSDKLGNGNKICDDEGWLAPINDMPQAEDSNMPFIQDTKL